MTTKSNNGKHTEYSVGDTNEHFAKGGNCRASYCKGRHLRQETVLQREQLQDKHIALGGNSKLSNKLRREATQKNK